MSVNILCSADPSVKAKAQISLYASWGNSVLKMQHSTTRQEKQKILSSLKQKMLISLCANELSLSIKNSEILTNDADSSHWLWLESSHSVKNVIHVESPFFPTWFESNWSHDKSWLDSSYKQRLFEARPKLQLRKPDPTVHVRLLAQLSHALVTGVAKLRLASRMRLFEPLHAALWAFRKIIYLFFMFCFYCKV